MKDLVDMNIYTFLFSVFTGLALGLFSQHPSISLFMLFFVLLVITCMGLREVIRMDTDRYNNDIIVHQDKLLDEQILWTPCVYMHTALSDDFIEPVLNRRLIIINDHLIRLNAE